MKLKDLIQNTALKVVAGNVDREIGNISFDSRKVVENDLFVAIAGSQVDGHDFIDAALSKGATAVVVERLPQDLNPAVTWLQTNNSAKALGELSAALFGHPTRQLQLVGVTGTNGKTTVCTLLHDLFSGLGYKTGLLSTVENRIGQYRVPSTHTTPDALSINALLAEMLEAGCDYVFMEVSSHAVDQDRISGLMFAGAVFTNMSHDHLDYHGSFKAYIEAKKKFFDNLDSTAFALVNVDDKRGEVMVQNTAATISRYGLRSLVDFRAKILDNTPEGLHLDMNGQEVYARLIGEFNAYNLLAAYGSAVLLHQDGDEVLAVLSGLSAAEGRLDYLREAGLRITGIVDYAHTPDALEKVLKTLRSVQKDKGRIITVVGAGGDRDRTKRPEMARISAQLSDLLVLTSDNPRSEDPMAILADMEQGLNPELKIKSLSISDRANAIRTAVRIARVGDVVLVAGKGHEKYQEIKGEKLPFDDKAMLQEAFSELVNEQNSH